MWQSMKIIFIRFVHHKGMTLYEVVTLSIKTLLLGASFDMTGVIVHMTHITLGW